LGPYALSVSIQRLRQIPCNGNLEPSTFVETSKNGPSSDAHKSKRYSIHSRFPFPPGKFD
jgi:hypothetical protein